jgi:hypothetical protein
MIVQFFIYGKSGNKIVYRASKGSFLCNTTTIDAEEYNKALNYFNANRGK